VAAKTGRSELHHALATRPCTKSTKLVEGERLWGGLAPTP
jgi:hypothetical protein